MKYIIILCCTFAALNLNAQSKLTIRSGGGGSGTPQILSFNDTNNELSITDGNTVDLSTLATGGSSVAIVENIADGTTTLSTTAPVNASIIAVDVSGQGLSSALWSSNNNVITWQSPPPPNGSEVRVWYIINN